MATINPNLGPMSTSTTAKAPQNKPAAQEALPAQPSDGLNVDFSAATKSAPKTPPAPAAESAPAPAAAPETSTAPAIKVGGVELAASDGGFALSSTGGLAQLETLSAPEFSRSIDGCLAKLTGGIEIKTITAEKVNWDQGADVTSNARKFIMPVPQFEGEPLVYPEGAKDKDGKSLAGTPIMDWQGQPIGDKGVVFFNQKDQAWQAVKSDGQGVIIMNQMTQEQSEALLAKVGGDPMKMSLDQLKDFLSFASAPPTVDEKTGEVSYDSGVGCKDMYNSDRAFIQKKMNAIETNPSGYAQFGMFRRDDQDVCKALFAEGPGEFEAPTGGGVMVKQPIGEEGGILVRQPDGKVFLYRKVDNEVFVETYKYKDGSAITLDNIPRYAE